MLTRLLVLGSCLISAQALTARTVMPSLGPLPSQGQGAPGLQAPNPRPLPPPPLTPFPTPPVDMGDKTRPAWDPAQDDDQNRGGKPVVSQENDPNSSTAAATAQPNKDKGKAGSPVAVATPDFEALGSLLDRISLDQLEVAQVLAGRPSLDRLDAAERSKAQAILADRDAAEQLLQAQLQSAPLPLPKSTPASSIPLATPTAIP